MTTNQSDDQPSRFATLVVVIPAYQPGRALVDLVRELAGFGLASIAVVDDGSGPEYRSIFEETMLWGNVRVLRHAVNLGKGAALKTGMNFALVEYPGLSGVVTADADGQHDTAGIRSVAARFMQSPAALVLGTRDFEGTVPFRSRVGNSITRHVMRFAVGHRLADTQTGLRAIPRGLLERLLQITALGYEFELEMLIAAKHLGIPVVEQSIKTIYESGNPTSHFQPLRDSMRIYFVLLRYTMIALLAAGLDNLLFYSFLRATGVVAGSLLAARCGVLCLNYPVVRKAVFYSDEPNRTVLPGICCWAPPTSACPGRSYRSRQADSLWAPWPRKFLLRASFSSRTSRCRGISYSGVRPLPGPRPTHQLRIPLSPKPMPLSNRKLAAGYLAVAALVVLVYSNHFHNDFQFDDSHSIVNNPYIRDLRNIPRFFTDAETASILPANRAWRPLVMTSLAIDYRLGNGLHPFYFHLSTLIWYLAQLGLMLVLFRKVFDRCLLDPRNTWVALFATALYGVHPVMAETVNYVIQRADLYSTLGVIAGLVLFIYWPSSRRWGLYLIPVAAAVVSKAPAMVFPAILFVYLWLIDEEKPASALRSSVPSIITVAVLAWFTAALTPKSMNPGAASAYAYRITQPFILFRYFRTFFIPTGLSADTDRVPFTSILQDDALLGFLFLAVLIAAIFLTFRRRETRPIAFGLFWFLFAAFPTSIFPLAEVDNDHRMFFPLVGLAMSACWAAALVLYRKPIPRVVWRRPVCFCSSDAPGVRVNAMRFGTRGNRCGTMSRSKVPATAAD